MKKLLIIPAALFCATAFAQKPEGGTITTEVGMSINSGWSNVSSLGLNGRYFLSPGLALNLGVGMSSSSQEQRFFEKADGSGKSGTYTYKNAGRDIGLGIQKHFAGTERLSPFAGLGFNFGGGKNTQDGENSNGNSFVDNYIRKVEGSYSNMTISFNFGFDYWFASGLFIGVQYSPLSFYSTKYKDQVTTINGTKTVQPNSDYSGMNTFNSTPYFRLGWRFN